MARTTTQHAVETSNTVVMYPVAPPTGKVRGMAGEARV